MYNDKVRDRYINFLTDLKKVEGLKVAIKPIAKRHGLNIEIPALIKTNLVSIERKEKHRLCRIVKCNYKIPVEPIEAKLLYEATKEHRKQFYSTNKPKHTTPFINIEPEKKTTTGINIVDDRDSKLVNEINRLKKENKRLQELAQAKRKIRFQFPIKFQSFIK